MKDVIEKSATRREAVAETFITIQGMLRERRLEKGDALEIARVAMEALTAASVAALTLYDMFKPHTKILEIRNTRLLMKSGGKSGTYTYEENHAL